MYQVIFKGLTSAFLLDSGVMSTAKICLARCRKNSPPPAILRAQKKNISLAKSAKMTGSKAP